MHLARVTGAVVSTQNRLPDRQKAAAGAAGQRRWRTPRLPTSGDEVAIRFRRRGIGELVLLGGGSSARHVFPGQTRPSTSAVVGIVDTLSR